MCAAAASNDGAGPLLEGREISRVFGGVPAVVIQNAANDNLLYLLQFEENVERLRARSALATPA